MIIYELTHIFRREQNDFISMPKALGMYSSTTTVAQGIKHYKTQPGFCDNQEAFSVRQRSIDGTVINQTFFEAIVYYHSADYEFEYDIELGLYGSEEMAQKAIATYCKENVSLINTPDLVVEKIVNKCIIDRRLWEEGFFVSE